VPELSRVLAAIPAGAPTHLELATHYVDHAVRDHLDTWVSRQRASGAAVLLTQRGPAAAGHPRRPPSPAGEPPDRRPVQHRAPLPAARGRREPGR